MKYENEIREIILNILTPEELINVIPINENLQKIGMNSISFIRIVVEIENKFNIEFPDEKLMITQAGTIKDFCEIVASVAMLDKQ